MSRPRALGVLAVVSLLWLFAAPLAAAETTAFTWSDSSITSPAGLATDVDHSLYWTANSTADTKTAVYAVTPDGKVGARLTYPQSTTGVQAVGVASGKVLVLDKSPKANTLRVSYIALSSLVVSGSLPYHYWDLTVPEAGQTPVALVVEPNTRLYVVAASGHVYRAPATLSTSGSNKLTKISDGVPGVTGGYYDVAQQKVVLRTSAQIVVVDPATFATTSTRDAPAQTGGRGITSSLDGTSYLLTGMGSGSDVLAVPLSSSAPSAATSGSASAVTSPSPAAGSVTPPPTAGLGSSPMAGLLGKGTLMALGAALLLAVVAGAVAYGRR